MLNFTRRQRNGLIVLSILIILFAIAPLFNGFLKKDYSSSFSEFEQIIVKAKQTRKKPTSRIQDLPIKTNSLFNFNPNTASKKDFSNLGLSKIQIDQIINYRNKKGVFYKKEDFLKIYAIDTLCYKRLKPYIIIYKPKGRKIKKYSKKYTTNKITKKQFQNIEINVATEKDLQKISGLGEVLSRRIIKYRNVLGGFVTKEQVQEVYGVDKDKFEEIKSKLICNGNVKKIKINFVSEKQLEKHPYFSKKQAKKIIKNRTFTGRYQSLSDFKTRLDFSDNFIEKIKDYLIF